MLAVLAPTLPAIVEQPVDRALDLREVAEQQHEQDRDDERRDERR